MIRKVLALALGSVLLAGCSGSPSSAPLGEPEPGTLRILAGSELADMQPVLDEAARATGVTVKFTFTGTLEGPKHWRTAASTGSTTPCGSRRTVISRAFPKRRSGSGTRSRS